MTSIPYPTTDDLQELQVAHRRLAAGIAAGPEGNDVDALAAAYDQGSSRSLL